MDFSQYDCWTYWRCVGGAYSHLLLFVKGTHWNMKLFYFSFPLKYMKKKVCYILYGYINTEMHSFQYNTPRDAEKYAPWSKQVNKKHKMCILEHLQFECLRQSWGYDDWSRCAGTVVFSGKRRSLILKGQTVYASGCSPFHSSSCQKNRFPWSRAKHNGWPIIAASQQYIHWGFFFLICPPFFS